MEVEREPHIFINGIPLVKHIEEERTTEVMKDYCDELHRQKLCVPKGRKVKVEIQHDKRPSGGRTLSTAETTAIFIDRTPELSTSFNALPLSRQKLLMRMHLIFKAVFSTQRDTFSRNELLDAIVAHTGPKVVSAVSRDVRLMVALGLVIESEGYYTRNPQCESDKDTLLLLLKTIRELPTQSHSSAPTIATKTAPAVQPDEPLALGSELGLGLPAISDQLKREYVEPEESSVVAKPEPSVTTVTPEHIAGQAFDLYMIGLKKKYLRFVEMFPNLPSTDSIERFMALHFENIKR